MELQIFLLVVLVVHDILLGRIFLFQRTVRKLAIRAGVDQRGLAFMYPPWMLAVCRIGIIRWIAAILLFYLNWKLGFVFVAEWFISFIVQMKISIRMDDKKNLGMILKRVKSSTCHIPEELRNAVVEEIEIIVEHGWN